MKTRSALKEWEVENVSCDSPPSPTSTNRTLARVSNSFVRIGLKTRRGGNKIRQIPEGVIQGAGVTHAVGTVCVISLYEVSAAVSGAFVWHIRAYVDGDNLGQCIGRRRGERNNRNFQARAFRRRRGPRAFWLLNINGTSDPFERRKKNNNNNINSNNTSPTNCFHLRPYNILRPRRARPLCTRFVTQTDPRAAAAFIYCYYYYYCFFPASASSSSSRSIPSHGEPKKFNSRCISSVSGAPPSAAACVSCVYVYMSYTGRAQCNTGVRTRIERREPAALMYRPQFVKISLQQYV